MYWGPKSLSTPSSKSSPSVHDFNLETNKKIWLCKRPQGQIWTRMSDVASFSCETTSCLPLRCVLRCRWNEYSQFKRRAKIKPVWAVKYSYNISHGVNSFITCSSEGCKKSITKEVSQWHGRIACKLMKHLTFGSCFTCVCRYFTLS